MHAFITGGADERSRRPSGPSRSWPVASGTGFTSTTIRTGSELLVEGLPAGLEITVDDIQSEMARRRLGYGRGARMKFEQDAVTTADGRSGVSNLTFGGSQGLSSSSRSNSVSFQNTLSWFDEANKHRVKLTTELQYNGNTQDPSNNLLGTFFFNSAFEHYNYFFTRVRFF
mgnify:CR=1 FL=1